MRKALAITIILTSLNGVLIAQGNYLDVSISSRHIKRLDKISSPAKKLDRYRKFYSKDSIRMIRDLNRYWTKKSDSLTRVAVEAKSRLKKHGDKLFEAARLEEEEFFIPSDLRTKYRLQALLNCLREHIAEIGNDSSSFFPLNGTKWSHDLQKFPKSLSSSKARDLPNIRQVAKDKLNSSKGSKDYKKVNEILANGDDKVITYKKYSEMLSDSIGKILSQRIEAESKKALMEKANLASYQNGMAQMKEIRNLQTQYQNRANAMSDSARIKELARKKAEDMALKYLSENTSVLQEMEQKLNKLLRKYSVLPNSNDLSTSVKRTSLRGKALRERLVLATNFEVLSLDPVTLDLSPQVGYRFNSQFSAGIGFSYRQTFKDSVPGLSTNVIGTRAFASQDIVKSFFIYGEYSRMSPGMAVSDGIGTRIWKSAAFVGAGRRFAVHKKLTMNMVALYNIFWHQGDNVYPRRFTVRVGLQLSEQALMKKKPPEIKY